MKPDFMTVQEAAAYLRVSKMTVYRLIENESIAAYRIGRSFRIKEKDLEFYVQAVRTDQ